MLDKEYIGSILRSKTDNKLVFEIVPFSFHVNRITEIRYVSLGKIYIYNFSYGRQVNVLGYCVCERTCARVLM